MTLCYVNVIFLWWMKQRHIFYIFCVEFSFSDVGIWWCKKFSDSLKIQSSYIEKIKEQLSLSFAFSLIYRYTLSLGIMASWAGDRSDRITRCNGQDLFITRFLMHYVFMTNKVFQFTEDYPTQNEDRRHIFKKFPGINLWKFWKFDNLI